MIFITESGSRYEIDTKAKQIRRMYGKLTPTIRVGKDCEWKPYHSISNITIDKSLIIVWDELEPNKITLTSRIVEINPVVH